MSAPSIRCPECGTTLSSAEAIQPGKLVDCPRCRLLFAPTPEELQTPLDRGATPSHPSPTPWEAPRRRQRANGTNEMLGIFLAAAVMLVLAGVVVGTYVLYRQGISPPPAAPSTPAAPSPPMPATSGGETKPAPAEVEDTKPNPRRPVPQIDDPPGRGGTPKALGGH